jgi:predicted murein hydrolase (TIGR00659 family)
VNETLAPIFASPFFGITLSVVAFEIGVWIEAKTKLAVANPLLIAVVLCIAVVQLAGIPLASFNAGGEVIAVFLGPATAVLALSVYQQLARLKKYFLPVIVGTVVGSAVSVSSAYWLCQLFGLDKVLTNSMLVKSVTTPFAMAISKNLGGLPSVSVAAVVLTGILGAVFAPLLIKVFHVTNPIARGVAIGTSSHAVGTSKAILIGEVEGAMSGVSIGLAGIVTVVISLFLR